MAAVTVLGEEPAQHTRTMAEIFRPHWKNVAKGGFWLAITDLLLLAIPRLVNEGIRIVENGAGAKEKESVLRFVGDANPTVAHVVIAIVVAAIIGSGARVMSRVVLFNVGRDVERNVRSELFAHMST